MRSIAIFLLILFIGFTERVCAVTFEEANEMLHAGNTPAAVSAYEQLIDQGLKSSAIYANLGRAFQQQDKIASAALNYHRALMLNPRRQEPRQGLAELSQRSGLPVLTPRWTDGILERVSLFSLLIGGGVFFWVGTFSLLR